MNLRLVILFSAALVLFACNRESENYYEFESAILNEYLQSAAKQIISLSHPPEIIELKKENLLLPKNREGMFASNLFGIHAFNNKLIAIQINNEPVLLLNEHGEIIRALLEEGSGPFEIRQLSGVAAHRSRLFVADFSQMVIHHSDSGLQFDSTLEVNRAKTTANHQSFTVCGNYAYVPLGLDSEHIIELVNIEDIPSYSFEIFPKIIKPGFGHQAHNILHLSCQNDTLLGNLIGLPYLFLFNAGASEPEQVLILDSEEFKQLNKDVRPVNEPQYRTGSGIRVSQVMTAIHLGKSGNIYTTHNGNLLILGKDESQKWKVMGEYYLITSETNERVSPFGITTSEQYIYIIHPQFEYIIRLEKNILKKD